MAKKKFVIIAQTIFPAQTPRSFRATELAKQLARSGHEVILYAVLGHYDYTQFENTYNIKVKNIGKMLFARINSSGSFKWTLFDRGLKKLFGRILEFPDVELMFRIPAILKKERGIDCLITVAMPFPLHWGAALAKYLHPAKFPKIWIADCGDPYMGSMFRKHSFYFKYIEKWFCRKADYITIPTEEAKQGYYREFFPKIQVIPQGFNFNNRSFNVEPPQNAILTFGYAGNFYRKKRDPGLFLEYLATLNLEFKFVVYTQSADIIRPYIKKLGERLVIRGYIPREELLSSLGNMDFLVNFENGTHIHSPSKLIDYALTNRPILNVNPEILPLKVFKEFLRGDYSNRYSVENLEQYNIINVSEKFVNLSRSSS